MNTKIKLAVSSLFLFIGMHSQNVAHVYKIADLVKRIDTTQGTLVINFWATWCKPCVQELPAFDSLTSSNNSCKVILVCLDFKEDIDKKVNPFLKKNKVITDCVLLDEINGNDYINQISDTWSGAIPATLFVRNGKKLFVEKKMKFLDLQRNVAEIQKPN